jgi:hypothetical protein
MFMLKNYQIKNLDLVNILFGPLYHAWTLGVYLGLGHSIGFHFLC